MRKRTRPNAYVVVHTGAKRKRLSVSALKTPNLRLWAMYRGFVRASAACPSAVVPRTKIAPFEREGGQHDNAGPLDSRRESVL